MSAPATPKVSRTRSLPLVWVVPLIALAVGGWMIFREFQHRGHWQNAIPLSVAFPRGGHSQGDERNTEFSEPAT